MVGARNLRISLHRGRFFPFANYATCAEIEGSTPSPPPGGLSPTAAPPISSIGHSVDLSIGRKEKVHQKGN
eukprot:scaffold4510_cov183-Amphora_coffeaeformis.AAC.14